MPKELLTAGRTNTILTYKSEGSVLSSCLKKLDVPVVLANNNQCEEAFRKKAAELITIKHITALSRLSLSHSGQLASMSKPNYCRTVVNALKNLKGRQLKDVPAENILITCAKDGWHKKGNVDVVGPFALGSQLFQGANWVPRSKLDSKANQRDQRLRTLLAPHLPLRPAREPLCGTLVGRQHKSV